MSKQKAQNICQSRNCQYKNKCKHCDHLHILKVQMTKWFVNLRMWRLKRIFQKNFDED